PTKPELSNSSRLHLCLDEADQLQYSDQKYRIQAQSRPRMPFLLLLVLTFSCFPVNWPRPPAWIESLGQLVLRACGVESPIDGGAAGSVAITLSGFTLAVAGAWIGGF